MVCIRATPDLRDRPIQKFAGLYLRFNDGHFTARLPRSMRDLTSERLADLSGADRNPLQKGFQTEADGYPVQGSESGTRLR
jgi:hypothetical protein